MVDVGDHPSALVFSLVVASLLLWGCQGNSPSEEASGPPPLPDGELAIEGPWVRPAPAGSSSVLSMTIANGQSTPDTLLDVRAPIIDSTQGYAAASDTSEGPRALSSFPVQARSRAALAPDSQHVALRGLQQPLTEGESLVLTLEFAQSGLQRIRAPIQSTPPTDTPSS